MSVLTRNLLAAGLAAPLAYLATVIIGGWLTPGYSHLHQPVSALFEAGAPLALPVSTAFVSYNLLLIAFGFGLLAAFRSGALFMRLAAAAIILNGVFGLVIELAPMDPLGADATIAGTLHLVLAGLLVVSCTAAMAFNLRGWTGRRARPLIAVTLVLLVVMLATGALAAMAAAQAWPLLGLYQRFTIGSYLLWVFMVAFAVLREGRALA